MEIGSTPAGQQSIPHTEWADSLYFVLTPMDTFLLPVITGNSFTKINHIMTMRMIKSLKTRQPPRLPQRRWANLPFIEENSYDNADDKDHCEHRPYNPNQAFLFICDWLWIQVHWHNRIGVRAGCIHLLRKNRVYVSYT